MALSDEDKFRVVNHLGYSGKVLIEGSTHYNSIVNSRLNNLNAYIEDEVDSLLTQIDAAKVKLNSSPDSFKVKQVGDIHFNVQGGQSLISKEYKRLLTNLSNLLDIPSRIRSGLNVNVVQ